MLRRIVGSLFTLSLSALAATQVLDRTVLNARYMADEGGRANLYSGLAAVSGAALSKQGEAPDQKTLEAVQQVLTPEFLRQKVEETLRQFEDHYKKGAPEPRIDLSDFFRRAREAGLQLPGGENPPPIVFSDEKAPLLKPLFSVFSAVAWVSQASTAGLGLLLVFLCAQAGDLRSLAGPLTKAGTLQVLFGILMASSPALVDRFAAASLTSNAALGLARGFAGQLAWDLGLLYGALGAAFLSLGLVVRLAFNAPEEAPPAPKKK